MNILSSCTLCPRLCRKDRTNGETGYCGASDKIRIGRAALHFWEEPSVSGESGAGTVFFSYCTLKCVYCQNYGISTQNRGREITVPELAEIFLQLMREGANNIDLVTPTHYVPQIKEALDIARAKGMNLPVVYNTSGYEREETVKSLAGYVDVWMPDLKYYDDKYAVAYSNAKNYFAIASKAIETMFSLCGKNKFNEKGIMQSGLIVRHLMLPGLLFDTKKIMDYLYGTFGNDIYVSLMSQYTPIRNIEKYENLNRKLNMKQYQAMVDYCAEKGMENVYIQEGAAADESFIPDFGMQ